MKRLRTGKKQVLALFLAAALLFGSVQTTLAAAAAGETDSEETAEEMADDSTEEEDSADFSELSLLTDETEEEDSADSSDETGSDTDEDLYSITVTEIDQSDPEGSIEAITDALVEYEESTASDASEEETEEAFAVLAEEEELIEEDTDAGTADTEETESADTEETDLVETTLSTLASSSSDTIVVAIDPGHDSKHTGATSTVDSSLKEHKLTLKIAKYCKAELEEYEGVEVYMTRTTAACPYPDSTSTRDDIRQRVAAAVKAGASIYVSIHLNYSSSSSAKGAEVIYQNYNWKSSLAKKSKTLANDILDELVSLGLTKRRVYYRTDYSSKYTDGSYADYFAVQLYSKKKGIPGIIVEHAFLSNSSDVKKYLSTEAGLKKLGVADAAGIAEYLGVTKWCAPTMKSTSAVSGGTKITWSAITNATGYVVYRKTKNGSWEQIGKTTSTSYTDKTTKENGCTYYYSVRAYRGTYSEASSNKYEEEYWTARSSSIKTVYTATPELSKVTAVSGGVKVSWEAVSGVTGYVVYRKVKGGTWEQIGKTTSTSYKDKSSLSSSKQYYYTVRAYRGSYSTAKKHKFSARYWSGRDTDGLASRYLAAPALKLAKAVSSGTKITWSSVSKAAGYAVLRKVKGGSWELIGTTTSTSYTDKSSLKAGKTYYYTVRAYRSSETTALKNKYRSQYWSYYDTDGLKSVYLASPELSGAKLKANGVKVTWSSVSKAAGYAVFRKTSGGSWTMIGTTTSTSYTDKTAGSKAANYYYTIRAYRGKLSTAKANTYSAVYWSGYDSSGARIPALDTPVMKSISVSETGITVKWGGVTGASGYVIYRKVSGGSWAKIGSTTSKSYTDETIELDGTTYYYAVRAYAGSLSTANKYKYKTRWWSSRSSSVSAAASLEEEEEAEGDDGSSDSSDETTDNSDGTTDSDGGSSDSSDETSDSSDETSDSSDGTTDSDGGSSDSSSGETGSTDTSTDSSDAETNGE